MEQLADTCGSKNVLKIIGLKFSICKAVHKMRKIVKIKPYNYHPKPGKQTCALRVKRFYGNNFQRFNTLRSHFSFLNNKSQFSRLQFYLKTRQSVEFCISNVHSIAPGFRPVQLTLPKIWLYRITSKIQVVL